MKLKNIIFFSITCLVTAVACKKDFTMLASTTSTDPYGQVKIYSATLGAVRNYVYVNGVLLTGSPLVYGGTFPSNDSYFGIQPTAYGTVLIKDTAVVTTQPSLTFQNSFSPGKYTTIFTYDTITSIKYKVVDDTIVIPTDTTARIRLANLFFSTTTIPNIDVYSQRLKANIFTNIPTATITGFMPYQSKNTDTLYFRESGTTNPVFSTVVTITADQKRSYTLILRGRYATTTGTIGRTITSYVNY